MLPNIILDTITIKNAPLLAKLRIAAASGFDGVELRGYEVDEIYADKVTFADFTQTAERLGLQLSGVCPDTDVYRWHYQWDAALEILLMRRFEVYRHLGLCYVIFPVMSSDGSLDDTKRNYERLCDLAGEYHLQVGLEFIGHIPKVSTFELAYQIVSEAGKTNGGVVLDLFHFYRGGSAPESLDGVLTSRLLCVHVSDAMRLPKEELVGGKHRVFPGHGQIDVVSLLRLISESGYTGPYVVELFNEQYWVEAPEMVALQAFRETVGAFLASGIVNLHSKIELLKGESTPGSLIRGG